MKYSKDMTLEEARSKVLELRRKLTRYINAVEDLEDSIKAWQKWAWDNADRSQLHDLYDTNLVPEHFIRRYD